MPSEPIPLCEPFLGGREREYVDAVLESGWVSTAGAFVNQFETAFAARLGQPEAVAVASGTAALHLALLAAGVCPNDEVLVPSMTFIASANAVRYAGAWPVFADAESDTWQMDVVQVRDFLETACTHGADGVIHRATGRRVAALLPVHILGHPVDMAALRDAALGLPIIEDATESLGALCHGQPAGTIGEIGCFSFNGNKLITSGGGGMVVARDPATLRRIRHLSTQAKLPGNEYIHDEVGFNYRLTNLQAALGFGQFEQIDRFLERKRTIADTYRHELAGLPGVTFQAEAEWARSAWWLFTALFPDSRGLIRCLAENQIAARPLWQPMHRSAPHAASPSLPCPVADRLFADAVSLPSSVGLSEADQARVCAVIRRFVAENLGESQPSHHNHSHVPR
jgi:perosamine synthetase